MPVPTGSSQMEHVKLLEELSNLHGAPGHEDDVVNHIIAAFANLKIERDCLNNLFVTTAGFSTGKPVVALDCHSDEVGFLVEGINANGTVRFLPLGGWHITNIPAHAVVIKNFRGEYVRGVVASKPPHFMSPEEKSRLPKLEELVIDIGSTSRKDTEKLYGIEIGNPITPDVTFLYDTKSRIVRGKAFDNRLGCAAVMSLMQDLNNASLPVNPVGVISSQEEVGLRGAQVSAGRARPDFAIIFEGSPADDTFRDAAQACGVIGGGVQFRVLDAGMVSNPKIQAWARRIAAQNDIPFQVIARSGGSTNGARYHLAMQGVPTLVIGIPARYIHTHHSYASLDDFENAIRLGKKLLESLDAEVINSFQNGGTGECSTRSQR